MNKKMHPQVEKMFVREDQEKFPYEIVAFNLTYTILPGVFSPKVRSNSLWYATKVLTLLRGDSFLEIGAGAGILAVEAANRGYTVVATDIDSKAVENIKLNAKKHNTFVDVRKGDVFDPINRNEKFDTIFWNHPWIYAEEQVDKRHQVSFDYKYQSLKKFIREAKYYLKPQGQILLGTGNLARIDLILSWAKEEGYVVELMCKESQPLAVGEKEKSEFLIYSFRTCTFP